MVKVKKMVRESRKSFHSSLDANFESNPKRFWSIFKPSNKQSSVPDIMSMGNDVETDSSQRCAGSSPTAYSMVTWFNVPIQCHLHLQRGDSQTPT